MAGAGYAGGYFDAAYALDRGHAPVGVAKADQAPAASVGVRGAADVEWRSLCAGLLLADSTEAGLLSAYLQLARPTFSVAAMLTQRAQRGAELIAVTPASVAMLDGSLSLVDGVFAFAQAQYGTRRVDGAPAFDWLAGLGWAAE